MQGIQSVILFLSTFKSDFVFLFLNLLFFSFINFWELEQKNLALIFCL